MTGIETKQMQQSKPSKLETLKQKAAEIQARIQAVEARENKRLRAERTRALLLLGQAFVLDLQDDHSQLDAVRTLVNARLKPQDAQQVLAFLEREFHT